MTVCQADLIFTRLADRWLGANAGFCESVCEWNDLIRIMTALVLWMAAVSIPEKESVVFVSDSKSGTDNAIHTCRFASDTGQPISVPIYACIGYWYVELTRTVSPHGCRLRRMPRSFMKLVSV